MSDSEVDEGDKQKMTPIDDGESGAAVAALTTADEDYYGDDGMEGDEVLHVDMHPETLRAVGYAAFWAMCALAIAVTKLADIDVSDTPLITMFGYNNLCVYFDYSPSREVTAMVFPLVEYSLLLYTITSRVHSFGTRQQGLISQRHFRIDMCMMGLQIILLSWFRMIFVVEATVNLPGHTYGFIGLQAMLCMVAVRNWAYFHILGEKPVQNLLNWMGKPDALSDGVQLIIE